MTRLRIACISIVALALVTACVDRAATPEQTVVPDDTTAPAPSPSTGSAEMHELLPTLVDAEAFPLATGSFIIGSLTLPAGSHVSSFAIQVGNYANTADGAISVDLCQNEQCARGQTSLAGSVDNQYLEVTLDRSLDVIGEEALTYRVTKVEGTSPVAIWLYQPTDTLGPVKVNDQTELARTARVAVHF